MTVLGIGHFHYQFKDGLYRLTVEVDAAIVDYYRSLLPKTVRLNKQKYEPHISVVRETAVPNLSLWGSYEGVEITFEYSVIVRNDDTYYWLEVYNNFLGAIREELGLDRVCWYTRPPDGADCFHITIGNQKTLTH